MRYKLFVIGIVLSWWPMMAVHELGHVISVLINGGSIEKVILWPWTISHTIRSGSLRPVIDIWAGPVIGSLLPLMLAIVCRNFSISMFVAFFSGFCLITNGVYLGSGWIVRAGDTGELLHYGFPIWPMILFGVVACCCGLYQWHTLGSAVDH